jgi:hypothetical protein
VLKMRGEDTMQLEIFEALAQHLSRRFGRIAFSPIRRSEPVAKLGVLVLLVDTQANATDLASIIAESNRQPDPGGILEKDEKVSGVLLGIGMRDAEGCGCHFARADQRHQFRYVAFAIGTQP